MSNARALIDPIRPLRPRATVVTRAAAVLLSSTAALSSPATPDCRQQLLQELGWRFVPVGNASIDIHAGAPCDRIDLVDAQAAGDLVVRVPSELTATERVLLDEKLLHHPATHCAFGFALGSATRRAVDRLVGNDGFRFSSLQTGWIGFGATGAARDGWTPVASFGRGYRPRDANSRAIQGFYTGHIRAECGVGRQVAQYAAQAELYRMDGFDAEFDADEIVIGTFRRVRASRSILIGSSAGRFSRDAVAVAAAHQGRQAFMGLPGFIYHVFGRNTLDDLNNQAENFVVYDVSTDAATALRTHAGFEYYNQRNREIWSLARSVNARKPRRFFERLLYERDSGLRATLSPQALVILTQLDSLLSDPFYRGFEVYVHRQGVKPVGFHIARLLDRNPRTPFRIELSPHNVHTTLYDRYVTYRIGECERTSQPSAPNPPTAVDRID